MPLAVLTCLGCEGEPAGQGEPETQDHAERMAAVAAATGGEPLGRGGYIWDTEDAILALTLTEHGTITSLAGVKRMTPEERARALVEAAEWDLYDARRRLAELEGPNHTPVSTMTLAEDVDQTRRRVVRMQQRLRQRREGLDRVLQTGHSPTEAK